MIICLFATFHHSLIYVVSFVLPSLLVWIWLLFRFMAPEEIGCIPGGTVLFSVNEIMCLLEGNRRFHIGFSGPRFTQRTEKSQMYLLT